MGVNIYYGNLADATVSTGNISVDAQYPISNINVLNKNIYTYLNDNDTTTHATTGYKYLKLVGIDAGAGNTITASSCAWDVSDLRIRVAQGAISKDAEFDSLIYTLRYSDDGIYTVAIDLLNDSANIGGGFTYDETLNGIYTGVFTEASHRYWALFVTYRLTLEGDIDWDIDGKINNLYLGDYLSLPDPDFYARSLTHKTSINTSYTGLRSGQDTQGQRKAYNMVFDNLSETEKDNIISFDDDTGGGAYPVYIEHTSLIDAFFARVIGGLEIVPTAYQNYRCAMNIEEEL